MKELNDLVELAKKATSGEWSAFISTGGEGTFSIHTPDDSRKGDIVNWPGFDTANCSKAQKLANAKFIAASNPATILAIAEVFRALEQRAEAAEATIRQQDELLLSYQETILRQTEKLAELEKQEPFAYTDNAQIADLHKSTFAEIYPPHNSFKEDPEWLPLFTRPAPAVSLAELVPAGWQLVPVEPTEKMVIDGFESAPDESFSTHAEWEKYQAMSGCEQAAHKARLCWAAMMEAAPEVE